MDPDTYQKLAIRTAKDYPTRDQNLLYFSLGLVGEAIEVLSAPREAAPMEKELGDVLWYTARLADLVGITMGQIENHTDELDGKIPIKLDTTEAITALVINAGAIGEIIKKVVRDGRQIDRDVLLTKFAHVYAYVQDVAQDHHLNLSDITETNIKKLEARYPKLRFDAQDAIARADGERLNE